jgi:multidrug efflux pump subunit AcrA (membrane-fusion protein)
MADLASLLVEADVAEAFLPRVWIGQPCEIQMDALPRERFGGSVDTIVPTADRTKGTVLVKVRFDQLEARILPEMSARVAFLARPLTAPETRPVLAVHQDAVTTRNGETGVFLREAGRVLWTPLEPLVRMGDYVVLGEPFQAGDQAVLKPPPRLKPGQRINVSE